jgi:fido (protein-threonine AMPylation protein)
VFEGRLHPAVNKTAIRVVMIFFMAFPFKAGNGLATPAILE